MVGMRCLAGRVSWADYVQCERRGVGPVAGKARERVLKVAYLYNIGTIGSHYRHTHSRAGGNNFVWNSPTATNEGKN